MTKFKWINRWITADLSGIHIMAAVLCVFLYGAGYLIPSSRLMTAGYAGLFLTILFFLLHLQLHACDNFLSMHPSTDHIPKSQMKLVNGVYMAVFLAAATVQLVWFLTAWLALCPAVFPTGRIVITAIVSVVLLAGLFWWNMIAIYLTSVQLGLKHRVLAALCGWIPGLNIWYLTKMIRITAQEAEFETEKWELDTARAESEICKTRYPILMVHGVFFPGLPLPQLLGPHSPGTAAQRCHHLLRAAAVRCSRGGQRTGAGGADSEHCRGNRLRQGEHHRPLQGRIGQPGRHRPRWMCPLCGQPHHHQHAPPGLHLCRISAEEDPCSGSAEDRRYLQRRPEAAGG